MNIDDFCADELWNPNLTWHTDRPVLTRCLAQVGFKIFPSIVFFVLSFVELKFTFASAKKSIGLNNYNVTRVLIVLFAIYTNLSLLYDYLPSSEAAYTSSDVIGSVSQLLVFILLIVIYHFHRVNGVITSGILFANLLLNTTCSFVLLLDTLLHNSSSYSEHESNNITRIFLCNLCLFVLSCFTDDPVEAGLKPGDKDDQKREHSIKEDDNELRGSVSPKQYASFLSKITYYWYTALVKEASRRDLKINDIYELDESMKTDLVVKAFTEQFNKERECIEKLRRNTGKRLQFNSASLLKVIWRTCKLDLFLIVLLKTLADVFRYAIPILLNFTIGVLTDPNEQAWHLILLIIGFLFTSACNSIFTNFFNLHSYQVAINLRTALSNLVFHKALRLNPQAKQRRTTGQIINLFQKDANRFNSSAAYFAYIFSSPLQIFIGFYLLYLTLGSVAFVSIFFISLIMASQYFLNKYRNRFIELYCKKHDDRIMLINEVLSGIKIIKLYAWEKAFIDKITKVRNKSIHYIKMIYYIEMLVDWIFFSFSPFLILTTTFAIYIFFVEESEFSAQKVFVTISIFNILDYPIESLPTLISKYFSVKVSIKRLSSFFGEDEQERYVSRNYDEKMALTIKKRARFAWKVDDHEKTLAEDVKSNGIKHSEKSNEEIEEKSVESNIEKKLFELKDIELEVSKGSFTAIIGAVASGKSSLISAILGEMLLIENDEGVKGEVNISKDQEFCYVAQLAFIQNESFKRNITFGKPFDQEMYQKVIDACALKPDLQQFEAYDETEIGEKGINLSGGQKQRVSLARACYTSMSSDRKHIILLDDPLSAVDAHVCQHLCKNVLNSRTGILKGTTRILVTNQLNQLGDLNVDQIVLLKEGKIALICTYDKLMEMEKNGELDEYDLKLTQNNSTDKENQDEDVKENESANLQTDRDGKKQEINLENKNLIEKEKREQGRVQFKNYAIYLRYFGFVNVFFGLLLMMAHNFFQIYSRVYLADWTEVKLDTNDTDEIKANNRDHLLVFASIGVMDCLLNILANLFILFGIMNAIKLFHETLLYRILRSKISFIETTPMGRIMQRFNRDIEAIDEQLPQSIRTVTIFLLRLLASIMLLVFKQPNSTIFYLLIFAIYFLIMNSYISSSRNLRRYDSTTKSPVYSKVGETIAGLSTLKAYNKIEEFEQQLKDLVDINTRCYWHYLIGARWLKFYLDILANSVLLIVTVQFIFQKDRSTAGDAGLLITYALNLTGNLNFLVRFMGEFETNSVSIERLNEYCNVEMEDEWEKSYRPGDWPRNGSIEFKNYSTRYREGTNLVLKNLSFRVESKEKIGVVGRTGAGKSTITLALFRIIEPVEGQIMIDNIDITQIGLHDLRSKLSIIPQDPVLFTGSIRFNLDPFNRHTDGEIYQSLEHAHLRDYVNTLQDGIEHQIAEGGENLSVGQRQLICLARALLRKSKILVLDEATASVDFTTDELVQKTIRSEFQDCTIITIAHRLKTVADSSKILVLDNAELREYDEPEKLLKKPESLFYSLAFKAKLI